MKTSPEGLSRLTVHDALHDTALFVTGCNTGIGREVARRALDSGARLLFTCRTEEKVATTTAELRSEFPTGDVRGYRLELTEQSSVDALADRLEREGVTVDALILNAGVHVPFSRRSTKDGHELHHQVNFLAPARLFLHLCSSTTPPGRVLYVSSEAHQHGHLPAVFPVSFWARYARSKLLATTFFVSVRPLFPSTTISVLSPGNVETDVHRHKHPIVQGMRRITGRSRSAAVVAGELLEAMLSSEDPQSYRNRGRVVAISPRTADPVLRMRAWRDVTEGWTAPHRLASPDHVLENHAGTLSLLSPEVAVPRTETEVSDIVRRAAGQGCKVRVVGARHSYNDCFYSPSSLLSLRAFDDIGELDEERRRITVGSGVTVQELCDHLDARGFALPWAGNSGKQTFVGAAITGTHGYCRDGGLLAELIVGARVVTGEGEILDIEEERDLCALRVSLGTLGIITRVTLSLVPAGTPVRYALKTFDEVEFCARLGRDARAHAYYRFFPSRYHPERFAVLTIDPLEEMPSAEDVARIGYIDEAAIPKPLVALLRAMLGNALVHRILRRLPAPRLEMSLVAPFSTLLFVNAGIVNRWHRVVGLAYQAWNDDRTHNTEFAIRPEDFATFLTVFRRLERDHRARTGDFGTYFTGRYVGGSRRTLIGPNRERDVVFIDLHVRKGPHAQSLLRVLEARLVAAVEVRPHWAKAFEQGRADLERAYPPEAWAAFREAKRRYDPANVLSNAYTERVFGW